MEKSDVPSTRPPDVLSSWRAHAPSRGVMAAPAENAGNADLTAATDWGIVL